MLRSRPYAPRAFPAKGSVALSVLLLTRYDLGLSLATVVSRPVTATTVSSTWPKTGIASLIMSTGDIMNAMTTSAVMTSAAPNFIDAPLLWYLASCSITPSHRPSYPLYFLWQAISNALKQIPVLNCSDIV
jgi:hypothetical protein